MIEICQSERPYFEVGFMIYLFKIEYKSTFQQGRLSKKAVPTTVNNRKHLKGWGKIPIPKQIEDEEHDKKQTKLNENKKNKCPSAKTKMGNLLS